MPVRVQEGQRLSIVEDAFMRLDEIDTVALTNLFLPPSSAETAHPAAEVPLPKRGAGTRKAISRTDIARWRKMVLNGQYPEAAVALTAALDSNPQNGAAWSILSDCYRKQHRWESALHANEQVIKRGTPTERQRALFLSGEIYQDRLHNPEGAAAYFSRFSASAAPSSLRASALLRAAKAHLALGNRDKAFALIREILEGPYDEPHKRNARAMRDAH